MSHYVLYGLVTRGGGAHNRGPAMWRGKEIGGQGRAAISLIG
jgi:hypothetical protein